jgi:glycosyltransferase involved in cell wall biosynthesis
MALQLGVSDRVTFHGWADRAKVSELLADADVMVLPSHDEGLPLAILEAMAHRVAVLCTPVGEIPNVLANGRDRALRRARRPGQHRARAGAAAGRPRNARAPGAQRPRLYEEKFSVQRSAWRSRASTSASSA